jgi:AhpC/TSA family
MSFDLRYASSLTEGEACPVVSRLWPKSSSGILLGLAIAGVALLWTGQTGRAGDLQAGDDIPPALRLLDEVVKTYTALPSYVDHGQFSEVTRFRGKQRTKTSPVSFAFSRPNRLAFRSATKELVCDGEHFSIAWAQFRRYIVFKSPESIFYSTFTHQMDDETRNVALLRDQTHFHLVMALLSGSAQAARVPPFGRVRPVLEPDRKLDGKMLHSVLYTQLVDVDMAASLRLLIDPDTKLIRQVQWFYRFTPRDFAEIDKEEPAKRWDIETSWTASNIQTGAAPADLFTYRPPQDFTRVGNFKHVTLLAKAGFDQRRMVILGKPVPDFASTVLDNAGSSRKFAKSDLAGKVVVIAYWSMHDEQCFDALREIRKIARAANADGRVVLIALNVDEEAGDLKELGARVRQALVAKKVALEESRDCWIAVDPTGAISDLLPVAGLPAVVVLDGKGIVQSSHVGTGAELTDNLPKEIETLLAGAPLETPALKALHRIDPDESRPTVLNEEPGAFKKIEELGGIVIRAGSEGLTAEIDIQLGEKEADDELLAKLVPHLRQIKQIARLHLQDTRVTDAGLETLKGMSNIFSMNLERTSISDRGLDSLKTISTLKYVFLAGTRVTDDGILALKHALPDVSVYRVISVSRRKSTD